MAGENYIKRLERENAEIRAAAQAALDLVTEFRAHLCTPKFYVDTTIQIKDVDARLIEIASHLILG